MTPAELIALAEKHNILIPNAFDKDSFEETRGWTDEKWERFIKYYGYDENDDAIMESIEYFEEQDEEEEEEEEKCRCDCCDYSISKPDFEAGKGRIMFNDLDDEGFRCGVCDDRCDEEGELIEVDEEEEEEEDEEEEDFKIEINVVGLGWCRYKDEKDRDANVVYCKNGCWKIKGDKTAYDLDGNYCETDEEIDE
jgi:hypothetical protein